MEDDQVDPQRGFDDLADGVVSQAAIQRFDEVGGRELADIVPGVDRGGAQGGGLTGSGRPPIRFLNSRNHGAGWRGQFRISQSRGKC